MVSRGRSLIGRAGVFIVNPPIVPKFPSRGNFGDDGHVALGNESGFPKFPKNKYLGGDFVSGKAVHVWHFFTKICFPKRFAGFGLFGDLSISHCTLWDQIKNRDNLRVLNCSEPNMNRTGVLPPGTFGDVYTFTSYVQNDLRSIISKLIFTLALYLWSCSHSKRPSVQSIPCSKWPLVHLTITQNDLLSNSYVRWP